MTSERALIARLQKTSGALRDATAMAEHWYAFYVQALNVEHAELIHLLDGRRRSALAKARAGFEADVPAVSRQLRALTDDAGFTAASWSDPAWGAWEPTTPNAILPLTRIGQLTEEAQGHTLIAPALLPIIGGRNVVIKASGAGKDAARFTMQSAMLRLLATLPPGRLRFVCVDPVGLGATMAGLIKGLPDIITSGQAWFDSSEIESRLADLEKHISNVKTKYLGLTFPTIEAYNAKAGAVAEPYRLLVVADFPSRFSDTATQRLLSIATNGPDTGVYVLAMVDSDRKPPHNFNLEDLERTATVLTWDSNAIVWEDPDFRQCRIDADGLPSSELFDHIVKSVGKAALAAGEVRVPFQTAVPERNQWWVQDSRHGVSVPIGQRGAQETRLFELDEELLSSGLIIGRPGSGKSTLLHTVITNLALNYSPDELELYLIDFKQVEFRDYATFALPHARVVAIRSEREFGLSVLRGLDTQLRYRQDLFSELGFQSLSEYRDKTSRRMPRILFVADEFQELFSENDPVAAEASLILDRLVRMGRAFGINTLLASQTLAGPYSLSRATKDQIPLRIALQCSEADSRLILSDENDRARLLERPGEGLYNTKNGRIEGNDFFQVYWLANEDRERYLQQICEFAAQRSWSRSEPQIVFDSHAPANITGNRLLTAQVSATERPQRQRNYPAWLGEPVEIKGHTAALFRRQSGSNLLIIGQNEHEPKAMAMLLSATLSLCAQYRREDAQFVLLNLSDVDSTWHDLPATLAEAAPHSIKVLGRRGATEAIDTAASELARRSAEEDDGSHPPLFLVIIGLHRQRALRREEGYYSPLDKPKTPAAQLEDICSEGPDLGIHTLLWCDTYANLERVFNRGPERYFDLRVALQMSADDSRRLMDSDAASRLGPFWALYRDEERGLAEKFRPYGLPDPQWLAAQGDLLKRRESSGAP